MFRDVWCLTPHWKWMFIAMLLLHGGYHILFFDAFINLWNAGFQETEVFTGSLYLYSVIFIPLLQLVAGLMLVLGYKEKLVLGVLFYVLLFAGYCALDSNYPLGFMAYFGMAFFGLFVLSGQYCDCSCQESKKYRKIPTGGM
ncbi:hypothetical protein [Robertkochia sediminum]|uniref:hypothetical protein n=1 Tax=Robertkochia sediminum TaxID=2785326 RepID=UPI001933392E|nr:hypothetical protein [Robertkochia sediminum]MBL7472742.1 hypothetical protein [Robertkochia sediminum]